MRPYMFGFTAACVTLVAAFTTGAYSSQSTVTTSDPPVIVPWTKVGDIAIGMTRTAVEYRYRPMALGVEKKFADGYVLITFNSASNRVSYISLTTARYLTPDDIGVGTKIPFGK